MAQLISDVTESSHSLVSGMGTEDTTDGIHYDYQYDVYVYPMFEFERDIYLYAWVILVIVTCLVNLIVISVLMSSKLRNATNMILVAIAVSDSMTGLVTLPSYIMVYYRYEPPFYPANEYVPKYTETSPTTPHPYRNTTLYQNHESLVSMSTVTPTMDTFDDSAHKEGGPDYDYKDNNTGWHDNQLLAYAQGLGLDKVLCRYFMMTKFFVSKLFHTISIWLTLFLAIQRYISVAFPFKARMLFNIKKNVIICVTIAICSPVLHMYTLVGEKAEHGLCHWRLEDASGLAYLWISCFLMHLIPCVLLVIFTVLFVFYLWKGSLSIEEMSSCAKHDFQRRFDDNRRISLVVTTIVVVFLIPEIPYGVFLLYSAILKQTQHDFLDLNINRSIHASYELALVVSFHANFYIYTLLNRRFRSTLKRNFLCPVQRIFRGRETVLQASSTASSQGITTQSNDTKTMEMKMASINPATLNMTEQLEHE